MSAARRLPDPPEGDQGWKEVKAATYTRIVRRGSRLIVARITPTSNGQCWAYMRIGPLRGQIEDVWLNCGVKSVPEAMDACDQVLRARMAG